MSGWIDYWCNAFTPDRLARWDDAIAAQDASIKIRRGDDDSFATVETMVARMDELGIRTLVLPSCDAPSVEHPTDYALFTTRPADIVAWAQRYPGRFAGLFTLDPTSGDAGLRQAAEALAEPAFVGLHIHTHSWSRRFDHPDYAPFYTLAADRGVPVVMQAGASGGREPSEPGHPNGIEAPAKAYESVPFVLSHTGWPWVEETIEMTRRHGNVVLGTGAWPPHRWTDDLVRFIEGEGQGRVMLGTSFPVVGHRHALARLDEIELPAAARDALLSGTARRIFARLDEEETA